MIGSSVQSVDRIPVRTEAVDTAKTKRLTIIDMFRGLAMILMTVSHAARFSGSEIRAEGYEGLFPVMGNSLHILIGLAAHPAPAMFFTLAGVSVPFFENSRRKRGWTELQITRHLLVRALMLVILNMTLTSFAWNSAPYFGVLAAIGSNLTVLAFARRLPLRVIALLALGLFLVYPLLVQGFVHDPADPLFEVKMILLDHSWTPPFVEYPALGRLSLVLMGYVIGRLLREGKLRITTTRWLWIAFGGYAVSIAIHLGGTYGNFLTYNPNLPWIDFFVGQKQAPSMFYLLFNLAGAVMFLVFLKIVQKFIDGNVIGHVLNIFGQTSLFFFVVHLLLLSKVIGPLLPASFSPQHDLIRLATVFGLCVTLMVPICYGYRQLKRRYPNSILQYL